MLHSKVILPVVRQALVECAVLLLSDILRVARPDGLGLVELLVLDRLLLDLFRLLLLGILVDLVDLGVLLVLLDFLLVILNLLQNKKLI